VTVWAAGEIERLRAENVQMRGGLTAIARYVDQTHLPQVEWILDRVEQVVPKENDERPGP
jgi:hypothetical protein